jgi:DNA-binding NtrC family response regulator
VVVGEGHIGNYPLPDGVTLTVGRDPACEIPLVHAKISRRHARFRGGKVIEVEDLGSTNGIRVGGRRLAAGARVELRPGESVQLGPFIAVALAVPSEASSDTPMLAAISVTDPTPDGVPEIAARVAQSGVSVLITGETGAGKEVLARTLHQLSGRKGAFVAVNCATLSETLLESELFGHERGAFTGATGAKPGLFEVAAGGTVLLDEIGELPPALQPRLLRVLETRQAYRIGGVKPVTLDVRFLSATHKDLSQEVAEGRFRLDLFFRINGITLAISPLRERRDAIAALATELLDGAARASGKDPPRLGAAAVTALVRHDWPGNVRELRTVIDRALLLANGEEIRAAHILFDRWPGEPAPAHATDGDDARARLAAAAARHHGNVTNMAQSLGTSRSQVLRLVRKLGIDLDRYRE